jgi:hypothetical protein
MTHSANITGYVAAYLSSLGTKTDMQLNSSDKLVCFPMLDILADIGLKANVMHTQGHKPHPVGEFIAVAPRIRLQNQAFLKQL